MTKCASMTKSLPRLLGLLLLGLLQGCDSDGDRDQNPEELIREITIVSSAPNDGTASLTTTLTATLYLPKEHRRGLRYPVIIHSHGWGGSRISSTEFQNLKPATAASTLDYVSQIDSQLVALREAGYAVISYDQRGFGRGGDDGDEGSDGGSHGMSPDFEIEDAKAVVDWAATNLNLIEDAAGDPRVGLLGSSYGGAFQVMLAAEDPRIDAIVPSITWYNLRDSFAPNTVLKKAWLIAICNKIVDEDGAELSVEMEAACTQVRVSFNRELADAPVTESLFFDNSLASYFADPGFSMPKVDALILQGVRDTLFPLNEGIQLFNQLSTGGGDVRLLAHESGHGGVRSGSGSQGPIGQAYCGKLDAITVLRRWFDEKLYRRNGVPIPRICAALDNRQAVQVESLTPATGEFSVSIPPLTTVLGSAHNNVASATGEALFISGVTVTRSNQVLLGTPVAQLLVQAGPGNLDPTPTSGLNAAAVFIGIGIEREGTVFLVDDQIQPILSTDERANGTPAPIDLVAVAEKLEAGDKVGVLLYGKHDLYENHPIGSSSTGTNWQNNVATLLGRVDLPIATMTDIITR